MALATQCPHCSTIFRVAADQLKLRGGIVRCGSCHEVFDGNAALVKPAPKPAAVVTPVVPATPFAAPVPPPAAPAAPVPAAAPISPVFASAPVPAAAPPAAPAAANVPLATTFAAPPLAAWTPQADADLDNPPPDTEQAAGALAAEEDRLIEAAPASAAPEEGIDLTADLPDEAPDDAFVALADEAAFDAEPEPAAPAPAPVEPAVQASAPVPPADAAGRIEPTLDTPQEHLATLAFDELHHLGDAQLELAAPSPVGADADLAAPVASAPTPEPEPEPEPAPAKPAAPSLLDVATADFSLIDALLAPEKPRRRLETWAEIVASKRAQLATDSAAAPAEPVTPPPPPAIELPSTQEADAATTADDLAPQPSASVTVTPAPTAEHAPTLIPATSEPATTLPQADMAADDAPAAPAAVTEPAVGDAMPAAEASAWAAAADHDAATGAEAEVEPEPAMAMAREEERDAHAEPSAGTATPAEADIFADSAHVAADIAPVDAAPETEAPAAASAPLPPAEIEYFQLETILVMGDPTPAEEVALEEAPRDETALHAVAAVNADVPDDAASLLADEAEVVPKPAPLSPRARRAAARLRAAANTQLASGTPAAAAAEPVHVEQEERAPAHDAEMLPASQPELPIDVSAAMPADMPAEVQAEVVVETVARANVASELDHTELSFVKRHDRSQRFGKVARAAMVLGIPLLLGAIALQGATTFRNTLAAGYPELKPALSMACQVLDCVIELPTQLDTLTIEQGELQSLAGNTFSFTTVLRNQSRTAQAWPHIELILNDNADKPVLRRVLAPSDYLATPDDVAKGFGARTEQSVKLYFELSQLKASGYHIAIFYP